MPPPSVKIVLVHQPNLRMVHWPNQVKSRQQEEYRLRRIAGSVIQTKESMRLEILFPDGQRRQLHTQEMFMVTRIQVVSTISSKQIHFKIMICWTSILVFQFPLNCNIPKRVSCHLYLWTSESCFITLS